MLTFLHKQKLIPCKYPKTNEIGKTLTFFLRISLLLNASTSLAVLQGKLGKDVRSIKLGMTANETEKNPWQAALKFRHLSDVFLGRNHQSRGKYNPYAKTSTF